jgi:hypothetical protein
MLSGTLGSCLAGYRSAECTGSGQCSCWGSQHVFGWRIRLEISADGFSLLDPIQSFNVPYSQLNVYQSLFSGYSPEVSAAAVTIDVFA